MYYHGYQNPKLAAIRLLRSQGCCQNKDSRQSEVSSPKISSKELENLLRYKEQLQHKVAIQRTKLADIPCILELSKEIQELQQIIEGLSRENRQMLKYMKAINKDTNITYSTQCDEEEEQREHERLQSQYKILLKRLQKVNDRNSTLVNKLVNF